MNRSTTYDKRKPRAIRLGLSAGLSLGAIIGLVGCAEEADQVEGDQAAAIQSENGFNFNGFAFNGFAFNGMSFNGMNYNGMSYNGMSYNGMSFNGLATSAGLSSTSGMMTTEGGRQFVDYMVKIGYPAGHTLTKQDQFGKPYTFTGSLGVAPEIETGVCDLNCQEKMSGALLAHVNNSGLHVGIWLVGPDSGIGWGTSPNFPYQEGTYYGNLFANNMPGNYCSGKDMSAGDAKGRLGSPFGNNSALMNSPNGWAYDSATGQQVPSACSGYCTASADGFSSCPDRTPQAPYMAGHAWNHPVTVYRSFEPTMLFRICNRSHGKCLGTVGGSTASGATIEQRDYAAAAGQTWLVQQVSPGVYKFINKTSGMALDTNGTTLIQKPYTGASSQQIPLVYIPANPGFANIKMASNTANVFMPANNSTLDGALMQSFPASYGSADIAKWSFTAVGPGTIDPGRSYRLAPQHAPTKSIDIASGSTTNGTAVQQYDSYSTDGQKLVLKDAGKGNVKLTMKANNNKCVGPKAHALVNGTKLEVQDCNGGNDQAWITGETAAGSGIFMLKNVAAPGMCVDVTGKSTANGAAMEIYNCSGGTNQLFAAQAQ